MPTVIAESDLFSATMQRPNNGELADAGSLLTPLQVAANSRRYLYNRIATSGFHDPKRAGYNAAGTSLVNDQPAMQSAIDACAAEGGGVVQLPAGAFRIDSGLVLPRSVSLLGHPNGTVVVLNHATANLITFDTGTNTGCYSRVSGIGFGALIANTGKVFTDTGVGSRNVLIDNCTIGDDDSLLQGYLGYFTGPSQIKFNNCEMHHNGSSFGIAQTHATGKLILNGGRVTMPPTYISALVYIQAGGVVANGVEFDFSLHTAGASASGFSVSASSPFNRITNCSFVTGSAAETAIEADSTTFLVADSNSYNGVTRFSSGLLAIGSSLDLAPLYTALVPGASHTIPDGYQRAVLNFSGAAPTIAMPAKLFPGQELDLVIYNSSAVWGFTLSGYGLKASPPATLSVGTGASAKFIVADPTPIGTYSWVQVGGWATVAP